MSPHFAKTKGYSMTAKPSLRESVIEILAHNEHRTWSSWMEYMLDCAVKSGDDNIGIRTCGWPTEQFERWQQQIETDYEDLSRVEKASDRAEVVEATDAILSIVIKELEGQPKLQKKTDKQEGYPDQWYRGFNAALDQVKSILKEMGS